MQVPVVSNRPTRLPSATKFTLALEWLPINTPQDARQPTLSSLPQLPSTHSPKTLSSLKASTCPSLTAFFATQSPLHSCTLSTAGNTMEPFDLVFNHLVLPPKLPTQRDLDTEATGAAILARLQSACRVVSNSSGHDWSAVQHCLANCKGIADASFDAQHLLRDWADLGPDHVCLLRISEQNAALLIRRHVQ